MKKIILALLIFLAACQVPAPAYVTPVSAQPSVFKIYASTDGELESWGTAWVVDYDANIDVSLLVTAGHVCNAEMPDKEGKRTYEIESRFDARYRAAELKRVFTKRPGSNRWPIDLCLLMTLNYVGKPFPIMDRDPVYGEQVYYVGAPRGIWGDGEAPLYSGYYAGGELVSIIGAQGASGAPLFTTQGVFGVFVAGIPSYPGAGWFTSRENLIDFLVPYL